MKAKIVESAITLIESGEIDKFSVTQVAKYMGISQGNLTYHYPTKQALVEAIIDRLLERHTILLPESFYKNFDAKNTLVSDDALEHFMRRTSQREVANIMVFIWKQAINSPEIAQKLAEYYRTILFKQIDDAGVAQTQTDKINHIILLSSMVVGLIPLMGLGRTTFDINELVANAKLINQKLNR